MNVRIVKSLGSNRNREWTGGRLWSLARIKSNSSALPANPLIVQASDQLSSFPSPSSILGI